MAQSLYNAMKFKEKFSSLNEKFHAKIHTASGGFRIPIQLQQVASCRLYCIFRSLQYRRNLLDNQSIQLRVEFSEGNTPTKSFFNSLRNECVHRSRYAMQEEANADSLVIKCSALCSG